MPGKYVLPILMLVAWPLHVAFVRVAIEGVLRAAMSKTMIRKQRKAHPGFWNWLTYRGVASVIPLLMRIWYYCELLKFPIAALAFYVLMWLLGVPLNPLRKWPAIILISSELILVAYYVFFTAQGAGQRIAACPRGRSSTFPPTTATTESRGDDMRGKQSSKNRLKKRLLKRRQALTRRWDKQSTRRHLLLYLLCNLLLVGSLYGCIFAIPNVRDVRTVRTKITDVHYEAVRWAQWIAFTTPDGERFFLRRDWRGYDAAREDTARLQALAAGGTELELMVSGRRFSFLDMHSGEQQVVGVRAEQETFLPVSEWVADVCRSRVTDSILLGAYAVITLGGLLYLLLLSKT